MRSVPVVEHDEVLDVFGKVHLVAAYSIT